MQKAEEARNDADTQASTITVSVNERAVVFHRRRVTGAEIKATSIAQGVPIQQDFTLFEVKGHGALLQVGDEDLVELHPHEAFRAVAPDDNSEGAHDE